MSADTSAPVGLAMIICDQILEDKLTNKKSLIGLFNSIATNQFPCRHPNLCVYVALTEGRGDSVARLRVVHDEKNKVLTEIGGPIQFRDVNAVLELNFNLVGLEFPEPGLYSIEFYCDDGLVLERRFHMLRVQTEPPAAGAPPTVTPH